MNVPMSWLKEYVDINCNIKTFIESMTMSGSKVENVKYLGEDITNVVVGKIEKIYKHPNADKLLITKIDIGKEESLQIVTGAKNIKEEDYVPVALDGATLAKGIKIKKGKLRGEESNGMLCSIDELGYTVHDYPEASEDGIYIFTKEHKLGIDVKEILQLNEEVVEFEITSNRVDCFSIIGIAREASATFNKELKYPEIQLKEERKDNIKEIIKIEIKDSDLCNRYIARLVKNVKIKSSPQWLRHRLTASGIKPINNIVDITNYVMLEMGQPLHAFDIECISNKKIIIRRGEDNEKITTLDNIERKLDNSMLVISDEEKPLGIAGIMGGENSKILSTTVDVLFESANFNGVNIRQTSKKLGLRTDSSSKFEKGLDSNLALEAINRAMQLVELLECGEVVKDFVECYPNKRETIEVGFETDSINKLIGTSLTYEEIVEYLNRVGIKVIKNKAIIPSYRPDIKLEADLSEEVLRLYGYNNIKISLEMGTPKAGKKAQKQILEDKIKEIMVSMGFYECLNYSFESPKIFNKLNMLENNPLRKAIKIVNPLGEDFSIMRTNTLNSMLTSLSTNFNRRNEEAFLFEIGKVYMAKELPLKELPEEIPLLTIGMYSNSDKEEDFFYIKGVVENLFSLLNIENIEYSKNNKLEYMHPGRTATIEINNDCIGYLGEIHPIVLKNYELGKKAYVCVLHMNHIFNTSNLSAKFKDIPKYPETTRDISLIVEDDVVSKDIEKIIIEKGGKLIEKIDLFDFYKGSQIEKGFKSLSYRIAFRAKDRTLVDTEINKIMEKITIDLEKHLNCKVRAN